MKSIVMGHKKERDELLGGSYVLRNGLVEARESTKSFDFLIFFYVIF